MCGFIYISKYICILTDFVGMYCMNIDFASTLNYVLVGFFLRKRELTSSWHCTEKYQIKFRKHLRKKSAEFVLTHFTTGWQEHKEMNDTLTQWYNQDWNTESSRCQPLTPIMLAENNNIIKYDITLLFPVFITVLLSQIEYKYLSDFT